MITLGFLLLGPVPLLRPLLRPRLGLSAFSMGLQGLGSAGVYLGSLLYMMRGAALAGLPDSEQTSGMVSLTGLKCPLIKWKK